jgi:hypothetical protein
MKKKKLPPLRETPEFQALLEDLKKQTPEQLVRLKEFLEKEARSHPEERNEKT